MMTIMGNHGQQWEGRWPDIVCMIMLSIFQHLCSDIMDMPLSICCILYIALSYREEGHTDIKNERVQFKILITLKFKGNNIFPPTFKINYGSLFSINSGLKETCRPGFSSSSAWQARGWQLQWVSFSECYRCWSVKLSIFTIQLKVSTPTQLTALNTQK